MCYNRYFFENESFEVLKPRFLQRWQRLVLNVVASFEEAN